MTKLSLIDQILDPTIDGAWTLHEDGSDLLRDSSRETRFSISNGFLGVRGARAINREVPPETVPCTYVAGLFDTPEGERPISRRTPGLDWLGVRISINGLQLPRRRGDAASHTHTLDMKRGALLGEIDQVYGPVRLRLRSMRLVSQSERQIGLQVIQLECKEGEGEVLLEASFDGMALGLITDHLEPDLGVWRTLHSGQRLAVATVSSIHVDDKVLAQTVLGQFNQSWRWISRPGQIVRFERMVAIARSDQPGVDAGCRARGKIDIAKRLGVRGVAAAHEAAWASRWQCSDVEIDGDTEAQRTLRFAVYHLISAANPEDEAVSIGARALTGGAYLGHVFWDTEIFLLPFYIFTWPEAARALLMYRFHTLDGARKKALLMGWRGALYAWESAGTGAETTPEQVVGPDRKVVYVLSGKQEQHISADIAYAVWQYWQATSDDGFLRDAGAEILFETARFWSVRAVLEADGLHHIRGVIGPDEYHENIDDNAFTNVMARWNIRRALDTASLLRSRWPTLWHELSARLDLDESELERWLKVADTLATGLNSKTGLFEQFAGFHDLEDIDLAGYADRSVPMDVVLGRARTQGSQVIKQADVVALLALLPEEFSGEAAATNYRYYEPKCGHGSSLSRPMHGIVAARLGNSEIALRYFRETAAIDLSDTHVAIAGGIHIAALGGMWQMAVLGFAGLMLHDGGISMNPKLPEEWQTLKFSFQWHGRSIKIEVDTAQRHVKAILAGGDAMILTLNNKKHELSTATPLRVSI